MRELAQLLDEMLRGGVIHDYAVFGAAAQIRYTEPVATLDVDVLFETPPTPDLGPLKDIYEFASSKGWNAEGEAIRVGAWPVQFVPVFSDLTRAAVREAETADFEGLQLRVVRADYLAVIALSVGRGKDYARILALLESGSVSRREIGRLAARFELTAEWNRFEERFLDD